MKIAQRHDKKNIFLRWTLCLGLILHISFNALPLNAAEKFQIITVRSGDTLWKIASTYLKDPTQWDQILSHNPRLPTQDPTVALPGLKIKIPIKLIKEHLRAAELIEVVNDVRYRRRSGRKWNPAKKGTELFKDDGLRTLEKSRAAVNFPTGELLQISENSLIILNPERGKEEVKLLRGDIRAGRSRVVTARGSVVVPKAANSDFRAMIKPDKTELVFVYKGVVDVTAKGKTVTISEGFGTEIKLRSAPSAPIPLVKMSEIAKSLPDVPASKLKPPKTRINSQIEVEPPTLDKKGRTSRSVSGLAHLENYKLKIQIALDPTFGKIVFEKIIPIDFRLDFKKLGIPDGKYYLRTAYVDDAGRQSAYTPPQSRIIDSIPPPLRITQVKRSNDNQFIQLVGETEPHAEVSINNEWVEVDLSGRFSKALFLESSETEVVIITRDLYGNETNYTKTSGTLAIGIVRPKGTRKNPDTPPHKKK